jgi:segregation and condensation protein B
VDETRLNKSVKQLVENLLFLSEEPLTIKRMADSLPYSREEIAAALDALQTEYQDRGLKLREIQGGWQFTSDPTLAEEIETFFNLQRRKRLSRAALETLAIIAYNQPVTRAEVESIRGVQTSGTIQTLQDANLVRVVGQKETVGNPYLFGTTDDFLAYFGLNDASELPQLEFEREGLTRPVLKDGEVPSASVQESPKEATITPVDFGIATETSEVSSHVQQKGA